MTSTILPSDEKALAIKMFRRLVHEEAKVLLVVLGKGSVAETTFERAKQLTGSAATTWRHVCWARKPEQIAGEIAELKNNGGLADLSTVRAFSLSLADSVCHVIPVGPQAPDYVQLFKAFAAAERGLTSDAGAGGL